MYSIFSGIFMGGREREIIYKFLILLRFCIEGNSNNLLLCVFKWEDDIG